MTFKSRFQICQKCVAERWCLKGINVVEKVFFDDGSEKVTKISKRKPASRKGLTNDRVDAVGMSKREQVSAIFYDFNPRCFY